MGIEMPDGFSDGMELAPHEVGEDQAGHPLVMPDLREPITDEAEPPGDGHDPHHQDVDWIGHRNQGGGHVPADFEWRSNPRQRQEDESSG